MSATDVLQSLRDPDVATRRRALARAITLVESELPAHRERADALLAALPSVTADTLRIGISGTPGVGKSTLIESLGLAFVAAGRRVAVLAVDPSSQLSKGAILGDKTRMERLAVQPQAFVRPSASRGTLGGVAAATRDAIAVVEAAGFDVVIVETVGVGQSEAAVAAMTDCFVLLQQPHAGDGLQAIKKGVLEVADLVVVNKADLDAAAAASAVGELEAALRMAHGRHGSSHAGQAMQTSAIDPSRVAEVWRAIESFASGRRASGAFRARRQAQAEAALHERIDAGLRQRFDRHPAVQRLLPMLARSVGAGELAPAVAARQLLDTFDRAGGGEAP